MITNNDDDNLVATKVNGFHSLILHSTWYFLSLCLSLFMVNRLQILPLGQMLNIGMEKFSIVINNYWSVHVFVYMLYYLTMIVMMIKLHVISRYLLFMDSKLVLFILSCFNNGNDHWSFLSIVVFLSNQTFDKKMLY